MTHETLFLADLHLREQAGQLTSRLLALEPRLAQAEAVYILGDWLEMWIGDDAPIPQGLLPAFQLLARLAERGVPVRFQHGNRDFLIGRRLAQRFGFRILDETAIIALHGQRIALVHGDELCTDDLAYQRLRRWLRHPLVRLTLTHLPLRMRKRLAQGLRARSREETGYKAAAIMDVNPVAVDELMQRLGVRVLIHGHTHRPAIHRAQGRLRAVLGDWEEGAVLLAARRDGLRLERIDDAGRVSVLATAPWP